MKKVAIIGTVGVPAKYGGFETLVENLIGECCSEDVDYTVFCSGKVYPTRLKTYKNARLKYVPLYANGIQSILYDIWSLIRTIGWGYDVVLILGVSGCSHDCASDNLKWLANKYYTWQRVVGQYEALY